MKALVVKVKQWADWLDQRSPRERVLLAAVVLVVGFLVFDALVFHPQAQNRRHLKTQMATLATTLAELDRQTETILLRAKEDPDREHRAQQRQLQAELASLDERLKDLTVDLISPSDMAEVLRELLARQQGLRLVHLENLPPVALLPAKTEAVESDSEPRTNLYRHPVRIVVSGTYLQAVAYLRNLENLPRKLFWDELEIVVGDYPRAEISLLVYTLSHRKGWIGV